MAHADTFDTVCIHFEQRPSSVLHSAHAYTLLQYCRLDTHPLFQYCTSHTHPLKKYHTLHTQTAPCPGDGKRPSLARRMK
eukprot:948531-Rhodomonas_salina.1